jgi:hypothetical protein
VLCPYPKYINRKTWGNNVERTNADSCGTFSSAFPINPKYKRKISNNVQMKKANGSKKNCNGVGGREEEG